MAEHAGRAMVLPTDREKRTGEIGPWVRQLNIDELREDIDDTVAAIRTKVVPVAIGVGVAAVGAAVYIVASALSGDDDE
ncbi:hypothetical protein [Paramicrobacterium chengjingii]|uniref:DUF3618 domain-containing protein n=1 Tax=Paramicrobacterium chengjingii TaxID=2769067 RepID=A0ABX6YJL8_9MICO|nr:hypothetical protein [Microbacterium chengjingii]QPZ38999.1 hypothetical protein HCR76_02565 [Microbacterium chengjingii]